MENKMNKIFKRSLSAFLAVILVLGTIYLPPLVTSAGEVYTDVGSGTLAGDGSQGSPYLIASAADWGTLADSVLAGNTFAGKFVKLTADITVTRGVGGGLTSNDIASPFCGTFDGDGHTLSANIETSALCAAPFQSVSGTTVIKNLRVDGYVKGNGHPGGLVGAVSGTLKIENVWVSADVSGGIMGGFIGHGFLSDITVDTCAFTGNLTAGNWSGGLMAWSGPWENINVGSCTLSVTNWLFAGTRSDSKNFHPIALVGRAFGGGASCTVTSNVNSWSTLASNTTSDLPAGDVSYKLTAASVTATGTTSGRPWMEYHDVEAFPPTEGSFSDAFSAWTEGTTLALLADVTTASTITVPSGEHTLDLNGRGIKMTGSGSVVSLSSGAKLTIDDGDPAADHKFTVSDVKSNGAGLATVNDALTSGFNTFNGGYITGGNAREGGGVLIGNGAYLTLSGGNIIGNRSSFMGAGVKVSNNGDNDGNCFVMNGGSIIYNTINGYGGGVCSDAGVTITGGTIAYNAASNNPGGLHCHYLYISGGRIENNFAGAADFAAGAHADHEVFLSGDTVIYGNLCNGAASNLDWDRPEYQHGHMINVTGALGAGAKIGVTLRVGGKGVFTSGWNAVMGNADPAKYFTSDNANYSIVPSSGEAMIIEKPAASVTVDGNTSYYSDLSSAISAWTAGSTLKLYDDVTVSDTIGIATAPHTLDLNGYGIRMTGSGCVIDVMGGAELTVVDSDNEREHYLTLENYHCTAVSDSGSESISGGTGVVKVVGGYITGGQNDWERGGGIFVSSGGTLVMNGGALIGNCAGFGRSGGGMYVDRGASVTLAGNAQIVYNFTPDWGGAMTLDGTVIIKDNAVVKYNYGQSGIHDCGTLKLSGSPQIFDNELYNYSGDQSGRGIRVERPIVIDEPLTDGARIEVSLYQYQTGTFTSGWSDVMGNDDPAKYFVSEDSSYVVLLQGGEAVIGVPPTASVTSGTNTSYYYDLSSALSEWTEGSTLKLMDDATTSGTVSVPSGEHTLDLNGYGIKATSSGYSVITVPGGAELTIVDSAPERTGGANRPAGVTGGYITGGTAGENCGGGVTVDGGELTLRGGAISGNTNTYGAIGNCAGGVFVKSGAFLMEGGEISGNTSYVAGGVGAAGATATVSLVGGVIKNNQTTRFGSAVWAGRNASAVFIIGGNVEIVDNVSTWTSDKDGEGTINFVKTLKLSGDPTILGCWRTVGQSSPNTHINLDNAGSGVQLIEIDGALTNSTGTPKLAISPIYRWNDLANGGTFVFTSGWSTYMGSDHPAGYFKVDGVSGVRVIRKDGEAAVTGGSDLGDLYVFFDANGGEGEMEDQLTSQPNVTLAANAFRREGYKFTGWNTAKDGSGTTYTDKAAVTLSGDITLYAQWKEFVSLFEGEGTEESPYLIKSSDDWNALSNHINNGGTDYAGDCFKLTDDITVTTVLGKRPGSSDSEDLVFSGTFDGDGHTLNVNINDPGFAAPFAIVQNATIRNLHVTGTVTSTANHASGLIAATKGRAVDDPSAVTIENVTVSVDVSCNSHVAGVVGHAHGTNITMTNVIFDGSISASSVQGGFVGWGGLYSRGYTLSCTDCVFTGTYRSGAAFYPVAFASGQGSVTLENDFYTTSLGSGGSPITPSGSGQVKLLAATVELDGETRYFETLSDAVSNWTAGSTLRLINDATTSSIVVVPSGEHTLDLNGHELKRTGGSGDNNGQVIKVAGGAELTVVGPGRVTGGSGWSGGGIHVVDDSSLVLDNCEISGNTGHYGGGLYLNKGTITLKNGAVVKGNSAIDGYGGSGIYAEGAGTLILEDCTFTENEIRNGNQYAVFLAGNANMRISGAPVIDGNVYNGAQRNVGLYKVDTQISTVFIDGALTSGAKIGVGQTSGVGVFTSGWSAVMGETDPASFFVADDSACLIVTDGGEAKIGYPDLSGISSAGFSGDYDGEAHAISVTAPAGAAIRYGTAEGTYSLTESPAYTDVGTYTVYYEVAKDKFNSYYGSEQIEISAINATVTITGRNATVDYDGTEHTVSGYDVVIDTALYTEADFTFSGTASAAQTDAGTTAMGLTAEQFENVNANFATVTFVVTDGFITVEPIDVTVTINGHSVTVDYDGNAHSADGYDAVASSELYDVTADISYRGRPEALRTNAGTTAMGLAAEKFENTNANFATVTFNVTDGFVTVNPIDVTVTITGRNDVVDYDGTEHTVGGYDVVIENELYTEADFTFSGTDSASQTNAGTANMGLAAEQFANTNANFATVTFNVTDGFITVEPIDVTVTITGRNDTVDYDGTEHTVNGYDVVIGSTLYTEADFTFSGDASATQTNAGTTAMGLAPEQFANVNANFATVTFEVYDGYVTVNPIDATVTITGHSETVSYDGEEHTVVGYEVEISDPLYSADFFIFNGTAEASRSVIGTTNMGLRADMFENRNVDFANVTFRIIDGGVTVEPIEAVVTITGHTDTVSYDGAAHTVNGYDVSIDNELYKESDFTFSGTASAAQTEAGTANMGLAAEQFTNTNPNFATVTFAVIDGFVTVEPIDVEVAITGHTDAVSYDGAEHTVSGYDVSINNALYTEADFTFSGTASAAQTAAGTANMGLAAEQFKNVNPNFANVKFSVTDGYITVEAVDVTVSITGHTDTVSYDGSAHTVNGYDVVIDNALYTEADFTFSGTASAAQTAAGTANMGLAAEQFKNVNPNFANVKFSVTDGYITVEAVDVTVTITGHTDVVSYDGAAHKVSGYDVSINNALYTEADFTFSGAASAAQTAAGTAKMGLTAAQFKNVNPNFANVKFTVVDGYITVAKADVTVTITGRKLTVDYDGKAHSADGYEATASSALYDVTKDFVYHGRAEAVRTKAGTTAMGLSADKFENTNPNFTTVVFAVTDGSVTVKPISATVTIAGRSATAVYDGAAHTVNGYDVSIDNALYKESDFTFSGTASASRTAVGTAKMGLAAAQFANVNKNFDGVKFKVTDGNMTITPADAVVSVAPPANNTFEYTGEAQPLIVSSGVEGGTVYYALGENAETAPADEAFSETIPSASEPGEYYVWFKVVGDENHSGAEPACVKVTIAERELVTISGSIFQSDAITADGGATVRLTRGGEIVAETVAGSDGSYSFTVPAGVYNLVMISGDVTMTEMVEASGDVSHNVIAPEANTASFLDVESDRGVVVSGLDEEAQAIRASGNIPADKDVTVRMSVEEKAEGEAVGYDEISRMAKDKNLEYFEMKVEKIVDQLAETVDETNGVIEIVIPCSYTGKKELSVYRFGDQSVDTLVESDSGEAGTFRVDKEAGLIYIYAKRFATYALGYKPFYSVKSEVTLGSFEGTASVKLESADGGETYELENVSLKNISFAGVPKGEYTLTITWEDGGAENTIAMPFTIK